MDAKALEPMSMTGNLAENWTSWLQKFKNYLIASEVDKKSEKVQCAQLIFFIGEEALQIYNTFAFKTEETDKIEALCKKYTEYFNPKKSTDFLRYNFFTMRQGSDSIDQFIMKLKNAAKACEFSTIQDGLIKTQLTIGVANNKLREKLLQNSDLSLEKAVELCIISENAKSQNQIIETRRGNSTAVSHDINAIRTQGRQTTRYRTTEKPDNRRAGGSGGTKGRNTDEKPGMKNATDTIVDCTRCGLKIHQKNKCPAYHKICKNCNKPNHFASQCKTSKRYINTIDSDSDDENVVLGIDAIDEDKSGNHRQWTVDLNIDNAKINFKIDSGANVNIINEYNLKDIEKTLKRRITMYQTTNKLISYTSDKIPILGTCNLDVKYKNKKSNLKFYVTKGSKKPILGLSASTKLQLIKKIDSINDSSDAISCKSGYQKIINEYSQVFRGIGHIDHPYHIELDENVTPSTQPIRKIPFALEKKYKQTLDNLIKNKIIEPVNGTAEWVNPVVLVVKSDGSLRVCLDPKKLNNAVKREYQVLPTIDDLISKLNEACYFSILDATQGFWNIPLDEASSKLCTFGTPFGLYKFLRMPYGLKSAPEVFQKRFKQIFNVEGVEIYIDDILIWGRNKEEHDKRLKSVLEIAKTHNIKFNMSKCKFGLDEVKYLGHKFNKSGISMDEEKIQAIKELSVPTNKQETQRLLGLVTYLGRFISNLSEKTKPIRDLIKNDTVFLWTETQNNALQSIKDEIIKNVTLQYFNPNLDVLISVDASQFGLGAVLVQNGKPCAFASKSLTETQTRYAQIEKELLAICFGIQKFHQYIYGRKFIIETDHKPLIPIFQKALNNCPMRLQRMLLFLQKYDFTAVYKPGKELIIADTLSRACSKKTYTDTFDLEEQVCAIDNNITFTDSRYKELVEATDEDRDLKLIKRFIRLGWPKNTTNMSSEVKILQKFKNEITEINGLLYKTHKVIIPSKMRDQILKKIHSGHFGINKCQARANKNVYWPGINRDVESIIKKCRVCEKLANSNPSEPLNPIKIENIPWHVVATDIFETGKNKFLLIIDYYSKFVEVEKLNNITTETIIDKLKRVFRTLGIPSKLISDSGSQFTSEKFKKFSLEWDFKHEIVAPKHHQANGMAERAIQTVKKLINKCTQDKGDLELSLLIHHNTPIYDNLSPAELLMSRNLRDNLPALNNSLKITPKNTQKYDSFLIKNQEKYKQHFDKRTKPLPRLKVGQTVKYQEDSGLPWKFAKVTREIRDRTYQIIGENDSRLIRNRKHLQPTLVHYKKQDPEAHEYDIFDNILIEQLISTTNQNANEDSIAAFSEADGNNESINSEISHYQDCSLDFLSDEDKQESQIATRSGRIIKKVNKLDL